MAAPEIPNLQSLLRGRGGRGRGRGRGRGASAAGPAERSEGPQPDAVVQRTDDDAAGSRMSAVALGYLDDPFASRFWEGDPPRRFPIMNRGTYIRTTAIDTLVDRFLDTYSGKRKQIISLGAGTDTRYFRIITKRPELREKLEYHEIDFATNTLKKIGAITRSPEMLGMLHDPRSGPGPRRPETVVTGPVDGRVVLYSSNYNIHPFDLRDLGGGPGNHPPGMSNGTPTLIISECCLVYLSPSEADAAVKHFAGRILYRAPLAIIIYEPIRPHDSFGKVMISNLASRGIVLQTLKRYSNLSRQKQRLKQAGFDSSQEAADMDFLYERWVEVGEKERVAGLEMLDEMEEWKLLAQHYCVAWGWRDGDGCLPDGEDDDVFTKAWGDLPSFDGDDEDAF